MADEPREACEECEEGAPEWMVTFADLATLLLCFFVLLLSFSEMDEAKYKELRGSLDKAFGVQRITPAHEPPLGMKIVARNFDSAFVQQAASRVPRLSSDDPDDPDDPADPDDPDDAVNKAEKALMQLIEELDKKEEIEVETNPWGQIVMRLLGQTTFDSGRATIKAPMAPLLDKIGAAIGQTKRKILVAGHSDSRPLKGGQYGSNLGLSAARAASVVAFFLDRKHVQSAQIATIAFGEHRPLVPNTSPENRQQNRRVEIILAAMSPPSN